MAWSLVQAVRTSGAGGSPSVTFAATRAGTVLVAWVSAGLNTGNAVLTTPAGWSARPLLTQNVFIDRNGQFFYVLANAGGLTTVTFTNTGGAIGGWVVQAAEFDPGAGVTVSLDVAGQAVSGANATSMSQAVTTTAGGDLIVGVGSADYANNGTAISGPAAGWTNEPAIHDTPGFENGILSYQVQGSAGADTYTITATLSTDWMIAVAAFKAVASSDPSQINVPHRRFASIQ